MDFLQDNTFFDSQNVNVLSGTPDADQIFGLEGNDFIFGAESADQLFGNLGLDTVVGHQGDDEIYGGAEADLLFGGRGNDTINGDEGSDTIHGDRGTDILIGGEGEDVFVLSLGTGNFTLQTTNLIVDFEVGEDQIELLDGLTFANLNFEETPAGDTLIRDINSGEMLALLQGVSSSALTEESFVGIIPPEPLEPIVTLSLANDTGLDDRDNITSDPTLTGTVSNLAEIAELEIAINGEFFSINPEIAEDGTFTLSENQLESALNISFAENEIYTVQLRTVDTSGLRSNIAELTFTLAPDGDPPDQEFEFFPPGTDFLQPFVSASLANDTGTSDSDGITSDATIIGTAIDNVGVAQLEVSLGGEFVPVSTTIAADGTFTLTQAQLESALNMNLVNGTNTVFLQAIDTSGLRSLNLATVNFTLDRTAPTITAQLANDTGDNNSDSITTDPTIAGTVSDASEIVALRAGSEGNLIDISSQLEADGRFEFEQLQIEAFLGESLVENTSYTLQFEAEDEFGLVAQTAVSFTLEEIPDETDPIDPPPPPEDIEVIDDDDDDDTPPQIEPPEEREVIEEPGNIFEDALSIAVSSDTIVYSEQVSGDDLEDFYVFTLGAAGSISLDLTDLSSDADLVLLDSSGNVIDFSDAIGITDESITRPLEAGTYYIQVTSFDEETTDYDLSVVFTSRLGIDLTGSEDQIFQRQTNESSQLINLDPSSTDPSLESFRTDPRFEGIDGSDFSVVIIDSGIDLDHPFFGPDNNGDGVADRIVYHQDFFDTDGDQRGIDLDGHGSNVSSIVASEDDIYTGMAPGANIIHLKVFPDGEGAASPAALEQALSWVVENTEEFNIASVNMSLGFGNFQEAQTSETISEDFSGFSQLLEEIVAKDVIVVSASANSFFGFDSTPGVAYPSADVNSLSVGAVWDGNNGPGFWGSGAEDFSSGADRIASFSQRHPELTDIFAPGAFITGADQNGGTVDQGGTSQASPHIAGIAALAQQLAVQELGRRLTFEEFQTLLQDTGVTIFDGDDEDDNVFNTGLEFKRVDVLALGEAILELDGTAPPPPEPEPDLVRYDFAYLYDGATLEDDYYLGYTYAEPGTFDLGEDGAIFVDDFPGLNEDGFNGLYFVFEDTGEVPSDAILDEVYVTGYFDKDTSNEDEELYIPFFFEIGLASGFDGLGSELDFIELEDGSFDDFGFDFYEADGIEEIFSNARFTRTDYDANSQPGRLVNGDLNSDGRDELIVANTSDIDSGFSILFNEGDGSFEQPLDFVTDSFSSGAGDDPSLDVGDINGDGNTDLVVVNADTNEVSIYFGDGNGNFDSNNSLVSNNPLTFEEGDRPVVSATTDVDSDGSTDVVLINSEEFDTFYSGDSLSLIFNQTGDNRETLTAGEGVRDVVAADLDGDGDFDLATANEAENTVSVLINFGNAFFLDPVKYDVGDRPVNIIADDLDGDGTVDLATTDFGSDTVSVLRNSGNSFLGIGLFAPALTFTTNENPSTLNSADLDGDGDSDLVMRNSVFFDDGDRQGNSISLLLNNGDATFNEPLSFTVGEVPVGLIVEDLDGNGLLDIATSNFDSQDVTVYLQS